MDIECSQGGILIFQTEVDDEEDIHDFNTRLASWIYEDLNFRVTSFDTEDPGLSFLDLVTASTVEAKSLIGEMDVRMQLDKPAEDEQEVSTSEEVNTLSDLSFSGDVPMFKVFFASENGIDLSKSDEIYKWDEEDEEERIRESLGIDKETWRLLFRHVEFKEDALEPDSYELVGEYNGDKYVCHDR